MGTTVPGSCGYPILGDKSLEFVSDPLNFVQSRIEQHSSRIFQTRVLNNPTVFLCCPTLVNELLNSEKSKDFEHGYRSILHRLYGDLILFENDVEAMHLRSCLAPMFENLHLCQEKIDKLCNPFIKSLRTRSDGVGVYEEFKQLMTRLCLQLFVNLDPSTPQDALDEIPQLATQHWHGIISFPVNFRVPIGGRSTFGVAVEAKDKLLNHIRQILSRSDSHINCVDDTTLLDQLKSAPFPRESDLEHHLLLFISAVIPKAFSSIITSFIIEMAGDEKSDFRRRARADPEFLDNALLEVERMWPPLFGGRRLTKKHTTLGGFKIPKDYAVFYISTVSHRDPALFPDPDRFNPDRWHTCNAGHRQRIVSFGSGSRSCIGTKFIRGILKDIISRLLQDYDWSLSPSNQDITYKYLPIARPTNEISILFKPITDDRALV